MELARYTVSRLRRMQMECCPLTCLNLPKWKASIRNMLVVYMCKMWPVELKRAYILRVLLRHLSKVLWRLARMCWALKAVMQALALWVINGHCVLWLIITIQIELVKYRWTLVDLQALRIWILLCRWAAMMVRLHVVLLILWNVRRLSLNRRIILMLIIQGKTMCSPSRCLLAMVTILLNLAWRTRIPFLQSMRNVAWIKILWSWVRVFLWRHIPWVVALMKNAVTKLFLWKKMLLWPKIMQQEILQVTRLCQTRLIQLQARWQRMLHTRWRWSRRALHDPSVMLHVVHSQ